MKVSAAPSPLIANPGSATKATARGIKHVRRIFNKGIPAKDSPVNNGMSARRDSVLERLVVRERTVLHLHKLCLINARGSCAYQMLSASSRTKHSTVSRVCVAKI